MVSYPCAFLMVLKKSLKVLGKLLLVKVEHIKSIVYKMY